MKRIPESGGLVLLALVSVSCATTRIGADFDAAAPFSSLETYR